RVTYHCVNTLWTQFCPGSFWRPRCRYHELPLPRFVIQERYPPEKDQFEFNHIRGSIKNAWKILGRAPTPDGQHPVPPKAAQTPMVQHLEKFCDEELRDRSLLLALGF